MTITNKEIKIVIVVITPNLNKGIKDENIKLKNPIAVVSDVINTGIPTTQMILAKNGKRLARQVATETIDLFLPLF